MCSNQADMNDALSADLAEAQKALVDAREWIDILASELLTANARLEKIMNAFATEETDEAMARYYEKRNRFLASTLEGALDADSIG